ncbi:hypothetical protein NQ176_g11312 [Zarea fungicola]|uniref:Uncharacterized protein n=1 Tax=Zarea fungicola TaxID=93591 RepID=A0ACC1MAY8_9HYPO|nr:hypothetical protein NQ176_g11312 [Lecanicillium fungicola]
MTTTLARTIYMYDMRKAVGVEDPSEGRAGAEWGRHRPSEFQLVDIFTSAKKGPIVEFKKVNDDGGGSSGQSSNRFGVLGGGSNLQFERALEKYFIKIDTIAADLTTEKPTWILSAYAPGRDAPDQLFGGYPREQSFEEMRLHYMKGKAEGNEQKAKLPDIYSKGKTDTRTVWTFAEKALKEHRLASS